MLSRLLILGLLGFSVPLLSNSVSAQNILTENSKLGEGEIFFCHESSNVPVTMINLEKEKESRVFIRWYAEYLMPGTSPQELCRNVSNVLNEKAKNNQPIFLAAKPLDNQWKICLVSEASGNCDDDKSEDLLFLNQLKYKDKQGNLANKYPYVAKCFINGQEPAKCEKIRTRGSLLSIPSNSYVPKWWPF